MHKDLPFISIILPVYNGEKTLKATLDSLLSQTYMNFELLIGIDGTTDGSKEIAMNCNDDRIRIIENPTNLGLANNVNMLIEVTSEKAEYIAMAEQDDIYVPERIAWQVEVMEAHPNVGLVSGIAEFIGDGGSHLFPGLLVYNEKFPQGENLFRYLYVNQLKVVNTCMMLRKSVHVNNKLSFKDTYGNFNIDWDYALRFCLISEIYGIPRVLVRMNRKKKFGSVTTNKKAQHDASRHLLYNVKVEFPHLINNTTYKNALKNHRKIELGHHSKLGVLVYSIYYFLRYQDVYFLRYLSMRYKKYFT